MQSSFHIQRINLPTQLSKYLIAFLCLFFTVELNAAICTWSGKIYFQGSKIDNVDIIVLNKTNELIDHYITNNGKFELKIPFDEEVLIFFSKEGFDVKPIFFDNSIPDNINSLDIWDKYKFDIKLECSVNSIQLKSVMSFKYRDEEQSYVTSRFHIPHKLGFEIKTFLDQKLYKKANESIFKIADGFFSETDLIKPKLKENESSIKKDMSTSNLFVLPSKFIRPEKSSYFDESQLELEASLMDLIYQKEIIQLQIESNKLKFAVVDNIPLKKVLLENMSKVESILIEIEYEIEMKKRELGLINHSVSKANNTLTKRDINSIPTKLPKLLNEQIILQKSSIENHSHKVDVKEKNELNKQLNNKICTLTSNKVDETKYDLMRAFSLIEKIENKYKKSSQYKYLNNKTIESKNKVDLKEAVVKFNLNKNKLEQPL